MSKDDLYEFVMAVDEFKTAANDLHRVFEKLTIDESQKIHISDILTCQRCNRITRLNKWLNGEVTAPNLARFASRVSEWAENVKEINWNYRTDL